MSEEEKKRLHPKESPCRFCEYRTEGCHTPDCTHGWPEWDQYMRQRREEITKEKLNREQYYQYRKISISRMKVRGKSQRQAKKNRGEH